MMHEGIQPPNGEREFYKGEDIRTQKAVTIYENHRFEVPVIISPDKLAFPVPLHIAEMQTHLHSSMRSRFAQVGLEIEEFGYQLAKKLRDMGYEMAHGNVHPFTMPTYITNNSERAVTIPKDTHLFRLFVDEPRQAVQDSELEMLLGSGDIKIDGIPGVDWDYILEEENGRLIKKGLRIGIKDERYFIQHDPSPIIVNDSSSDNYRKLVDTYFVPVPKTSRRIWWVGETVHISLSNRVEAVIDKDVSHDISGMQNGGIYGRHINSRLIDGGKTNWPVRVEIVSATTPDMRPNYVALRLRKSAGMKLAA